MTKTFTGRWDIFLGFFSSLFKFFFFPDSISLMYTRGPGFQDSDTDREKTT